MLTSLPLAFVLAASVAACALALGALTPSGAVAAAFVGSSVLAGGGMSWSLILLAFFVSSSLLSRVQKARQPRGVTEKTDSRDAAQVLANGVVPAVLALLNGAHGSQIWLVPFAGSLAAATADTWATEIGRLSRRDPRLITTGRSVQPGTSGGITSPGTCAAACGAAFIAACAGTFGGASGAHVVAVAVGGFAGSLGDSVLGATVQERRMCRLCLQSTEQHVHSPCGAQTVHVGGREGINNDAVNFAATATGALVSVGSALALSVML